MRPWIAASLVIGCAPRVEGRGLPLDDLCLAEVDAAACSRRWDLSSGAPGRDKLEPEALTPLLTARFRAPSAADAAITADGRRCVQVSVDLAGEFTDLLPAFEAWKREVRRTWRRGGQEPAPPAGVFPELEALSFRVRALEVRSRSAIVAGEIAVECLDDLAQLQRVVKIWGPRPLDVFSSPSR